MAMNTDSDSNISLYLEILFTGAVIFTMLDINKAFKVFKASSSLSTTLQVSKLMVMA